MTTPATELGAKRSLANFDVLTCGEAMALFMAMRPGELDQAATFQRTTAGAELNVAIGLARLGLRVAYVSRVGQDALGRHLLAVMDRERIDRRWVTIDEHHSTGLMFKAARADGGDPAIEYFRRGSAASYLNLSDCPASQCDEARHVHLTGIMPALSPSTAELIFHIARAARAAGRSVSFDPNLRPRLWSSAAVMIERINALAQLSDWIFPGLEEGRRLTGRSRPDEIVQHYLDAGAKIVAVKLGAEGAYYATPKQRGHAQGLRVGKVVDTVGAGDGFAVGIISALLEGLPLPRAVARGNAIGARVVQFPGDSDGLPIRAELPAGV